MGKRSGDPEPSDALLFRLTELFFQGKRASQIRDQINEELRPKIAVTRQTVYPLLAKARKRGFLRIVPPVDASLAASLARRFNCSAESIRVVNTPGKDSSRHVAHVAAELALGLIKRINQDVRETVAIGLGPGRATLDFSRQLSRLLKADPLAPKLSLFAITAGCPSKLPEYASSSFFNLFPRGLVAERIGLFAETLVREREFEEIKQRPGVRDAFLGRASIRMVVTSMGDFEDPHDLLRLFLEEARAKISPAWVGNVQYRPYTRSSPVSEGPDDLRAVTVFELDELASMVREKNKHVILIARQCGLCGRNRAHALRPLFEAPKLRVFSELVVDVATAQELLSG